METDKIRIITGVPGDEEKEEKRSVEIEEEPERHVVKRTGLRTAWVVYCYLWKYYNIRTISLTIFTIMGIYEGIKGNGAGDKFVFYFVFGIVVVVILTCANTVLVRTDYDFKQKHQKWKISKQPLFDYIDQYYERKNSVGK